MIIELSAIDAAYLAGIVDGEGTITLTRLHRNENRRIVVSVSSTERCLLEHILRCTGKGHITSKRTSSARHSPSYTWTVRGRHALSLITVIAPHLRAYKRERAQLVLADYLRLTPRNGKYRSGQLDERRRFENRLLAMKSARR